MKCEYGCGEERHPVVYRWMAVDTGEGLREWSVSYCFFYKYIDRPIDISSLRKKKKKQEDDEDKEET